MSSPESLPRSAARARLQTSAGVGEKGGLQILKVSPDNPSPRGQQEHTVLHPKTLAKPN